MVLHERITRFVAEMKGKFSTFGPAACKPTQGPSINDVGNWEHTVTRVGVMGSVVYIDSKKFSQYI